MCDKCKSIFSENEEDWMTAPAAIKRRDKDGQVKPIMVQLDYCPLCTGDMSGGNNEGTPRVPQVEGRYNDRYTHQLEAENERLRSGQADGPPA
jgi:hypothetical protein